MQEENEKIFLGNPIIFCGKNFQKKVYERLAVIAKSSEDAREKMIHFCLKRNPQTEKHKWDIENLQQREFIQNCPKELVIESLQDIGIKFLGIDMK